ncbi:sister chromatid cohesion protein PDS5 homolog B-like, partial [Contarinia nasturtii]|uniref:sister chromatid cohesion protein PDS5 homolog B-like n=1 Tax=Contarinia nasturtii TaxID=265458 RepID=UPI0012D397E5
MFFFNSEVESSEETCQKTSDEGPDELIRRLKSLALTLQTMSQDENKYQAYIPLALHLVDDYFLTHSSRDVQLLIACCFADVLRVYAPEAPYKETDQVKLIFMFLIRQLEGLKDPKDPAFKRYFYLLENLAYVKSFNMCFELEESQNIFCSLFSLFFRIVNDEHSGKVKSLMLDVLSPLITEPDNVSSQLFDIILIEIVEPQKSSKKNAYHLAKELIIKTKETMEQYIQQFFNQALVMDKVNKTYQISSRIYDLIYKLNVIFSSILLQVLPQLECKLKSGTESERLKAVTLLARKFSEKNATLVKQYSALWRQFIQRFCDIAVPIRVKCVQSSMHFSIKAFIELQKNRLKLQRAKELTPKIQKEMCQEIFKQLPDPVKAQEFLQKFSAHLRKDVNLLRDMEIILRGDVSCRECADT